MGWTGEVATSTRSRRRSTRPTTAVCQPGTQQVCAGYAVYGPTTLLVLALPAHDVLVVHAGLRPGRAPDDEERTNLLTMRSIRADGSGSKRIDEGVPWASLWSGPDHVLFGHDAVRGLQEWPFATGLDTGCVYGRQLTAMLLPGRRLVSVAAKKAYADAGRGDKRR